MVTSTSEDQMVVIQFLILLQKTIMVDQFATEIGGELYIYPADGFMAMVGLTNGLIRNNIRDYGISPVIGAAKADSIKAKNPTILLKGAYDKTMDDFRIRLSASMYHNNSSLKINHLEETEQDPTILE
ncbi:MAG: hypothetical protein IPN89_04285 [Saprospiraceae bacterium]|nr:hypothetical protein [Saprospiraceae bacterium]